VTDVPTEVFKAFYEAKVPQGFIQMHCCEKKHVGNGPSTYSWDRGAEGRKGHLEGCMGGWIDGLMEKWIGTVSGEGG